MARALRVGVTVSAGFLVVFGLAGVALTAGARWVTTVIPWAALVVGIGLTGVGAVMLTGRSVPLRLPSPTRAASGDGMGATVLFGVSYAVASLSCTLPVFLVVVGGAGTATSFAGGVATFAVYAVGMALPLLGVAVALALGKEAFVRRIRGMARHTTRLAGGLLVLAGGYIVFYWATVLVPQADGRAGGALVTVVEAMSSRLTTVIGAHAMLSGIAFAAVIAAAAAYVWRQHRGSTAADGPADEAHDGPVSAA